MGDGEGERGREPTKDGSLYKKGKGRRKRTERRGEKSQKRLSTSWDAGGWCFLEIALVLSRTRYYERRESDGGNRSCI